MNELNNEGLSSLQLVGVLVVTSLDRCVYKHSI